MVIQIFFLFFICVKISLERTSLEMFDFDGDEESSTVSVWEVKIHVHLIANGVRTCVLCLSNIKQREHIISNINQVISIAGKFMTCFMRKPTFSGSDQAQQKTIYTVTRAGWRLEILKLSRRGIVVCL